MLANKLALVTGSSSGIGYSIAQTFAKQGANLVLVDLAKNINDIGQSIEKDNKIKVYSHSCDISDSAQVKTLFEKIKETYPEQKVPNVVVNSAGIVRDNFLVKMSEQDFDDVIRVNLKGTFLVTQIASKGLIENFSSFDASDPSKSYGSFINLASVIGKFGNISQANYAASKAGVEGFTRTVAKEMGRYKIRCNSILPGFIKTPMTDQVPEKYLKIMLKLIPLARYGNPEDVAQLALFLASDSSSYITGTSIECSGGMSF